MNAIENTDRQKMFRYVFEYAYRMGRYNGEGEWWGLEGPDRIRCRLAEGKYISVLRSEPFARAFFPEPLIAGVINNLDTREPWQPHHERLQLHEDPLAYCWRFLVASGRMLVARRQ